MKKVMLESPEFLKKSVIYQLFLRPFTPEGTLNAAQKLLPHIAGIGADIVYLCPVAAADDDGDTRFWSDRQNKSGLNNPKNPYRIKDFFAVDEEYGTAADLKSFIQTAHRLGLKVILDLVYLHCGPKAVFMDEHPDYVKRDENNQVFNGFWHFPLLNFDSMPLREYLWKNMEYFVREFDVDGYRCDVGDGCPQDFWETGRKRIEALKPDVMMLNEGMNPDYLLRAFDLNYNFNWSGMLLSVLKNEAPASSAAESWKDTQSKMPRGGRCIRALDNHDIASDSGDCRIESLVGSKAVEAALLLNFTLDGVPLLYNGYEIADTAPHSIFANRFHGKGMTINWANALTQKGMERLRYIRTLTGMRRTLAALIEGNVNWLESDAPESVVAFTRGCEHQQLAVVINFRRAPLTACITGELMKNPPAKVLLSSGADINLIDGGWSVDMLPYSYLVAEL